MIMLSEEMQGIEVEASIVEFPQPNKLHAETVTLEATVPARMPAIRTNAAVSILLSEIFTMMNDGSLSFGNGERYKR